MSKPILTTRSDSNLCTDMIFLLRWLKLSLFMATLFILIHYLFQKSENQCQMTFMMEPPMFIPIPIDKTNQDQTNNTRDYILFMYKESGFPLHHGDRSDLIDSMPVLFVPGNAGSYQQVRSLASTCIRHQLQSIDALKFVFYTIDFAGQLSGLSGDLVENQVHFVHSAIRKIIDIHPAKTNGIIIVGHSVGGFIAKALSTIPDFEPNSISLIINLASPITGPNLNFDRKLIKLYSLTDLNWAQRSKAASSALSISISSGLSDRLVPMHLSLDPQYDISITTSSIKDVWLTTDHVSITWCRELMNKIAKLMSALMDRKRTRLIEGKEQQMAIVVNEFLTSASDETVFVSKQSSDLQAEIKTVSVEKFTDYFLARRDLLIDSPILLNLTNQRRTDLLVWIEHIQPFEKGGIFGCRDIISANARLICDGRINLVGSMRTIPSLRYELKKKSFFIRDESRSMNYLILDFAPNPTNSETRRHKIPESISIQMNEEQEAEAFNVPTLLEYLCLRFTNPTSLIRTIEKNHEQSMTYSRYGLTGFNRTYQYYSIKIDFKACERKDKQLEVTALLIQDLNVAGSFHLSRDKTSLTVKLDTHKFILLNNESLVASQVYLDVFIHGPCDARLEITPDMWRFLEAIIQYHLSDILVLATLISSMSVIFHVSSSLKVYLHPLNAIFIYRHIYPRISSRNTEDCIVKLLAILVLASGLLALIESLTERLFDLATIILRFHHFLRTCVSGCRHKESSETKESRSRSASRTETSKFDYEWLVIASVAAASFMLSVTFMKLYTFFLLLKQILNLSTRASEPSGGKCSQPGSSDRSETPKDSSGQRTSKLQLITTKHTTLCALGLICYIPTALLKINKIKLSVNLDLIFFTTLICLIMVKLICSSNRLVQEIIRFERCARVGRVCLIALYAFVFYVFSDERDIRDIIYVEFLVYSITIFSAGAMVKYLRSKRKSD